MAGKNLPAKFRKTSGALFQPIMKIILSTLHSRYSHASLALPSIAASSSDIDGIAIEMMEFTIHEQHQYMLRRIIDAKPHLIAFSCYIWNINQILDIASDIKKIDKNIRILLGGPEVSFNIFELMQNNSFIDFVIKGEGELPFHHLIEVLISRNTDYGVVENLFYRVDDEISSGGGILSSKNDLDSLQSPFLLNLINYEKPLIYYETSRGCPFSCSFCLSSTETGVRSYSISRIKSDLRTIIDNRAKTVKFVDRTFNYDSGRAEEIWSYILENMGESRFHFEISAELLTESSIKLLKRVPADRFHFEIGVQSSLNDVLQAVDRRENIQKSYQNIKQLIEETDIDLHLDLIAGLPGEDFNSFLKSLNYVESLKPKHIQIEILKMLKGTKIRSEAEKAGYQYSDSPPYQILKSSSLSYKELSQIEIISRLVDIFYNSRLLENSFKLIATKISFSEFFATISNKASENNLFKLSTKSLFELFFNLVSNSFDIKIADTLFYDYCMAEMPRSGKLPTFIRERGDGCRWGERWDYLPITSEIKANSRVKTFGFLFEFTKNKKEYINFVYISAEDEGLKMFSSKS